MSTEAIVDHSLTLPRASWGDQAVTLSRGIWIKQQKVGQISAPPSEVFRVCRKELAPPEMACWSSISGRRGRYSILGRDLSES